MALRLLVGASDNRTEVRFGLDGNGLRGDGRTRLSEGVVPAAEFLRPTSYYNEVELFTKPYGMSSPFLGGHLAWSVLENLPIAVALETNFGDAEFVIPNNAQVASVLKRCTKDPRPAYFTPKQYMEHQKAMDTGSVEAVNRAIEERRDREAQLKDRPAEISFKVSPRYPTKEQRENIGGVTEVWIDLSESGEVIDVGVQRSSGNRNLDRAAIDAARRWTFLGAVEGGRRVKTRIAVPITFTPPSEL